MSKLTKKKLASDTGPSDFRQVRGPGCPMGHGPMKFNPEAMRFECQTALCSQVAWTEEQAAKGKPVIIKGDLEVVLTDDPDGRKEGLVMLRHTEGNTFVNITPYIGTVKHRNDGSFKFTLEIENVSDARTR